MNKKLLIVGGGYLGAELAKSLQNDLDVTLIDQRDAFVHVPAMIRAIVTPALLDKTLLPYNGLLSKGKFVKAKVTHIEEHSVTLEDGTQLSADYIVIATGSTNGIAFKPAGDSIDEFRNTVNETHAKLAAAKSIAIVGAGAVGTEMAGEIAHAMPDKKITLVSSETSLFPPMPDKFGHSLAKKLNEFGVEIKWGCKVENLESKTQPYSGSLFLSDGTSIEADLIIPAIGSKAASHLADSLPNVSKASNGRVNVDDYLRPSSFTNVFAAGDVADSKDAMTIVAISRQLPWLTKMFKALASDKDLPIDKVLNKTKPYSPWKKAPLLLPLGPEKGNSYLVIGTFGNWVTSKMKGKDLFISKYRKLFNL